MSKYLTCGEDLDALIESIGKAENGEWQILAVLRLGGDLLLRNYDLTDTELQRLFRYQFGSDESNEMIKSIIDVATGRLQGYVADPKPPPGGSC